jgi:hypothetical protein
LSERTVNYKIDVTYQKLKVLFSEGDTKILSEAPPNQLTVKQGSLWGVTPKTSKKNLNVTLKEMGEQTNVKITSKLSADWINITVIGCILGAVLAAVCVWMALDLTKFLFDGNPSVWSWIVTVKGKVEFQAGEAFVNLAWGLAIFLFAIIAAEVVVFVYAKKKINAYSKEVLNRLIDST